MYYEIEEKEGGQFKDMPEWLQDKIRASKEFGASGSSSGPIKIGDKDGNGENVPF
jgi:hypothetical protein